ncbi:LysR family transcriptional regulator [Phaeobacter inhibens]|jgi:DNA-binding transcriptional LysR family regulator|uniref:Transcriptional regulator n=1 Tax=Phaeobacter inhibens TaxID=221822 RepID=A0A2I7KG95_9RHOB|nr:LysR family transcriptional regulator [Phaeobacter inhibens]AUR01620.1 Transcriptional regulator [Phaeobacter inhibens]
MNFKQLTYFMAVADELHFGRAAERLGISQPPLSRQIKQMEEEIGATLFNRGRSSITLTQAGERLQIRGRDILNRLDDTRLEIKRIGQGAEGRLRIGFVGSSTYGILPNIIKSFRASYPSVNLSLSPMNNAQLHRRLVGREIDVAFSRPALNDPDFAVKKLMDEALIIALPDSVDTGSRRVADLRRLATHNLILYPEYPRPSYADVVINACQEAGFDVPLRVFTMDLQTALSLVAIGEGVCIVPESVGTAQRNGIKYLRIEPEIARTALSINYRLDEQGVHVRNFIAVAQRVARRLF